MTCGKPGNASPLAQVSTTPSHRLIPDGEKQTAPRLPGAGSYRRGMLGGAMGVVNLAWYRAREALEQSFWDDCYPINAGWPETFTVWQIAKLQTDNEKERSAIENKLIADFEGLDRISAPAVRQWMKGNAITPSVHIAAWFDSVIVETPTAAPVTPDNSGKPESTAERYARWLKWHDEELEKFDSVGALERVLKREEERCHPKKPPDRSTIGKAIAKLRKELSEQKRSAQVFGIR